MKGSALQEVSSNISKFIPKGLTLVTLNDYFKENSNTFFQIKALSDKDLNTFYKIVDQLDQNIRTFKQTLNINYSVDIVNLILNKSFTSGEMDCIVRDIFSGCSNLIEFRNKLGSKPEHLISLEYIIAKLPEHHNILTTFSDLIKCTPLGMYKFTKELEANVQSLGAITPGYNINNFCNKTIGEEENKYQIFFEAVNNIEHSLPENIKTIEEWEFYFRVQDSDITSKLFVLQLLPSSKLANIIAPICLELSSLDENTDAGECYTRIENVIREKNFTKIDVKEILDTIVFQCRNLLELKGFLQDNPESLMILQNVIEHNDTFQVDLSHFIQEVGTTYELLQEVTKRLYYKNIEDDCSDIIPSSEDGDGDSTMSDSSVDQPELQDFTSQLSQAPTQYVIVRPSVQEQHRQLYANLQQKINKLDYYIKNETNSLYPTASELLVQLTLGALEANIGALDTDYPMGMRNEIADDVKCFLPMLVPSVIGDDPDYYDFMSDN
ncbi:MAG TPA: hypothetical protein QKA08_00890 [Candidatus Megaira endosymbiont of Nemacystus decipiens]|nr:hypothetical protein [Candidatus Megaera endosymbiont of Nemacystus decipiens]